MTRRHAYATRQWERGLSAQRDGRHEESRLCFERAVRAHDDDALLWVNLAASCIRVGDLEAAERACLGATQRAPHLAVGWLMLGDTCRRRHAHAESASAYDKAESCGHEDVDAYIYHAGAHQSLGRPQKALQILLKASSIKPHHPVVHGMMASVFREIGWMTEAVECLKTLQALVPGHLQGRSAESFEKRHLFQWDDLDADLAALSGMLEACNPSEPRATTCFALLSLPLEPSLVLKATQMDAACYRLGVTPLPAVHPSARAGKPLRVGYVSSDFREHPVAQLMVEVLERRARGEIHTTLYDHGGDSQAAVRARLRASADAFVSLDGLSDRDAAQRIRDDGIDVLVDLQGHTRNHRLRIFSFRPAPVQVSYLGFPGSTGDPSIDYLIGDPFVTPAPLADLYTEKIAQLPSCFQPNGRWRPLPAAMTRAEAGLPDDAFVLCAFNHTYKILPQAFDAWCDVLRAVPRAVLWLKETNAQLHAHVLRELRLRGLDASRVYFARHVPFDQHFSRLALADVFVDTWPYNAHTTAADALWAGVPVVTVYGNSYASRVAASVLNMAGLPELALTNAQDYASAILTLANDPDLLASIRAYLVAHRMTLPLFDAATRAAELDALYVEMKSRWVRGLQPDHLWAAAADGAEQPASATAALS